MAENLRITITDKATHTQYTVLGPQIVLSGQSVVELPIPQTQIKSLVRHGDALVVTTIDGQVIVMRGFFAGGAHSDLATLDGRNGESVITYIDWSSMGGQGDTAVVVPTAHVASPVGLDDNFFFFDQNDAATTPATDADATVTNVDATAGAADASGQSGADVAAADGAGASADAASAGGGAAGAATTGVSSALGWLPLVVAGAGIAATASSGRAPQSVAEGTPANPNAVPPVSPIGGVTQNSNGTLTVTGQATAGDLVTVTYADGTTASATANTDGSYSITSAGAQTTGPISVVQADAAGNVSPETSLTWTDTTLPAVPAISTVTNNPDGTLTVTGTAEAGSTVSVTYPDASTATATAGSDGSYTVTSATAEANLTEVTAADAAGNVSNAAPYTQPAAPAAPTVSATTSNPDGTVTVTGTAAPGALVTVSFPDGTNAAAIAGSDGSYSIVSAGAEPNGAISVSAILGGSSASAAGSSSYTQTGGVLALTAISPDTGPSSSDFITSATALTFSGTLAQAPASGDVVQISFDGGQNWNTVTNITGTNWTYNDTANPFTSGAYNVIVRETDGSGHALGSWVQTITVETGVPSVTAAITTTSANLITGTLTQAVTTLADNLSTTASQTASALSQVSPLGYIVQVSTDGGQTWNDATFDSSGTTWSYAPTTTLTNGNYVIEARVMDLAGNVGQATVQPSNITDGLPPAPTQTVTLTAIGPDTGASGTDFITNTGTITLSGTYSAALSTGQVVQVSLNGGTWQDATVGASGLTWSYAASGLADGNYTVQTRVYDTTSKLAGAVTDGAQPVVIDSAAPAETVAIAATSADGLAFSGTLSGALNQNGGSTESLQISLDGGQTWQPASTINGINWTYTSAGTALSAGSHTVEARVVDLAGNTGALATTAVTVGSGSSSDTGGGAAPTQTASLTAISPDTGGSASSSDFITNATAITLSGAINAALTASEQVQVSLDGGQHWQVATLGANGLTWSYAASGLTDGSYTVQTRVYDASSQLAGAVTTSTQPMVIDTAAPTESITITGIDSDTGASATDFITTDNTLVFTGKVSPALNGNGGSSEYVQISLDGGKTWQDATVNGDTWTYDNTANPMADGAYLVEARIVDAAGNVDANIASQVVTVLAGGGTAPTQTATLTAISPDNGASGTDFITDTGALTLTGTVTGTLTSTEQVQVSIDGGAWQPATVNASNWTLALASPLAEGSHTVQTRVYDSSNDSVVSVPSSPQPIVVDTTSPTETVTIAATSADGLTFSGTLSSALGASGSAETLQISTDGGANWQTVPAGDIHGTNWSYISGGAALGAGSYTIEARVIDLAGNTGALASQTVTVAGGSGGGDTTVTQTATLTAINPDSGPSGTDFITDTGALTLTGTITGTLTSTEQVQVSIDGGAWQPATVNASDWTLALPSPLTEGSHTVQTRVYDSSSALAGSATSSPQPIMVDTTSPTEAITIASTSADGKTFTGTLGTALNTAGGSTETLQISTDGGDTWQPVSASDIDGTSWTYNTGSTALSAGSHTIEARVIDLAGNTGPVASQTVTVENNSGGGTTTGPTQTATLTGISPDTGASGSDFITDVGSITLSGTLSAPLATGQEVQIYLNGAWETVPDDNVKGTTWSYDATDLPDGSYAVQTRVFDTSSNQAGSVTNSDKPVVIDSAPPTEKVTIEATSADGLAFSGTLSSVLNQNGGSTESLQISLDGGNTWQPVNTVNGTSWTYTSPGTALSAGSHSVEARVIDLAGNIGEVATETVTVASSGGSGNTGAAPTQTASLTAISPDTGASGTDFITDTGALTLTGTITGTLTSTEQVQVNIDNSAWQPATVNASGTGWTLALPSPLAEGSHTVQTRVYDSSSALAGSTTSSPQPIMVDTTSPTEAITIAATSADGQTFTGTLGSALNTAGGSTETLQISTDGGDTWQPVSASDIDGTSWTYNTGSTALSVGSHTIEARVIDLAGNTGPVASQTVTVENSSGGGTGSAPTQTADLTAIDPDTGANTGGSATDFITDTGALTLTGTITGTLSSTEQVQVSIDDGNWQTATVDASGTGWTLALDSPLAEGSHTVQARVYDSSSDSAGSVSSAQPIIIDTTDPAEAVTIAPTSADGLTLSGAISEPLHATTDDDGSAEILQIRIDGGAWQTVPASDITGDSWSYIIGGSALTAGNHNIEAQVVDVAGNVGALATQVVTVEGANSGNTITQTATLTAISPDTGASATDFITKATNLTFAGTVSAPLVGAQEVQISLDGGANWQAASLSSNGLTWTYVSAVAAGTATVETRIYDTFADQAGAVASQVVTVDTTAPSEVVIIAAASNNGLTFSGALSAPLNQNGGSLESLQISLDGGNTWQTVPGAGISGSSWSYTAPGTAPAAGSSVTVEARVIDQAGNVGSVAEQTVQVGSASTGGRVIITTIAGSTNDGNGNYSVTSGNNLTLVGTINPPVTSGETVQVSFDGGATWNPATSVSQSGTSWELENYHASAALANGPYTVEARVVDASGQMDGALTTIHLIVGAAPVPIPTASIASVSPDDGASSSDFITSVNSGLTFTGALSGDLGSGQVVQFSLNGGSTWQTASVTGQTWTYTYAGALANGNYTLEARVLDPSGQVSADSSQAMTINAATSAPKVAITTVAGGENEGNGAFSVGSGVNVLIEGTINPPSPAETVQVSLDGGKTWNAASVGQDGTTWEFENYASSASLTDGVYTVQVQLVNAAGAVDGATASIQLTVGSGTAASLPTATIASVSPDTAVATDFITSANDNLTFSGALSAPLSSGQSLQISLDGGAHWTSIPAANVTSTGWSYTYSGTALGDGSHLVEVQVINGTQTGAIASQALVIDTTKPTEQINNLAVSSDGLTISGTLSSGLNAAGGSAEVLIVSVNGQLTDVPAGNIDSNGNWHLTETTALAPSTVVMAQVVDSALNAGPVASVVVGGNVNVTSLTMSPDSGVSASDFVTTAPASASAAPVLSGTLSQALPAGDQVWVSPNGGGSWYVATAATGATSWSMSTAGWAIVPNDGTGTYQVAVMVVNSKDLAVGQALTQQVVFDNRSFTTSTAALTLVTPDPVWGSTWDSAVTAWANAAGSTTAAPSFATNQSTGLTFTGTASAASGSSNLGYAALPGDTVQISLDGGAWETATTLGIAPNGSGIYWSYTDPGTLQDGSHTVQVRYVSAAGSTGTGVSVGTVVVDTHTPSETTAITAVTGGTAAGSGFTTDNGVLALTGSISPKLGTGDTNATESVQVSFDGGTTWQTATVADSGQTWTATDPNIVAPGTYDVVTRVVNSAGGTGQSTSQQITVTAGTTTPVTLAPVSVNTDPAYDVPVTSGNKLTFTANTAALPAGETVQFAVVTGADVSKGTIVNGGTETVNGDRTQWTFDLTGAPLADGMYTVVAMVADSSGQQVGTAALETFFVDTTRPTETVSVLSVSGAAPGSFVTHTGTGLVFEGTINSASATSAVNLVSSTASTEQVQVSLDGGQTWDTATAQMISGSTTAQWVYDYTGTALSDGAHTLQVRMVDAAGNPGSITTQTFVVDSQTSYAETLAITAISPDVDSLSSTDFITNASVLTFSGTVSQPLASGQTVEISLDNGATWQTATVSGTTWSYADPNTLTDGTYYALARVVDASGAAQSATAMQAVTVDTTAPTEVATITGVGTGTTTLNPTTDGSPMGWSTTNVVDVVAALGTGTYLGQDGGSPESVVFSVDGGTTWQQANSTIGYGTVAQYITNLSNGVYAAETAVVDAAGNVGKISSAQMFGVYSGGTMSLSLQQIAQVADATHQQVEITSSSGVTSVTLADGVGSGATQWSNTGPVSINGVTFNEYHNAQAGSITAADLLVQQGISVIG